MGSPAVVRYLDSVLGFCGDPRVSAALKDGDGYRCVEREISSTFRSALDEEEGLRLVREACDGLEREVAALGGATTREAVTDGG